MRDAVVVASDRFMDANDQLQHTRQVLRMVAEVGRRFPSAPDLINIAPLRSYFDESGVLIQDRLDVRNGDVTRREALLRMLLVSAVIDQGPDIEGVRKLAVDVLNALYSREVRVLHRPLDFFEHFRISVTSIEDCHARIKASRAVVWAKRNESTPAKYHLYMENSRQSLGYAVHRWGAPLALPLLLVQEATAEGRETSGVLYRYLTGSHESFSRSVEGMTSLVKKHLRYGLGKAIGDKAAHLFGKWTVHSFPLVLNQADPAWGQWSFEVPLDSNAGRVLYRTGIITGWLDDGDLRRHDVIHPGRGKHRGTDYMRVTNLRGIASQLAQESPEIADANKELCVSHLRTHKRAPKSVEVQRIPSVVSLIDGAMTPWQIDDGLIKIGTEWCLNTGTPHCAQCPLRTACAGAAGQRSLITSVRT